MSAFTKGPWFTGEPHFGRYYIYSEHTVGGKACMSGRQAICSAPYEGKKGAFAYHEMFVANARLIAAAPELLDALVLALPYVEDAQQDPCYKPGAVAKVIAEMRAAIAKATGEEP